MVVAGFLVWMLRDLDPVGAWERARAFRFAVLLPVMGVYLVAHGLRTWRLRLLLGGVPRFGRVFAVNAVGFLAINVVPFRLGELVRPYLLWERDGIPPGRSLSALFGERLLDFAMLLVMLLLTGVVVEIPADGVEVMGVDVLRTGGRLVAGVVVLGVLFGGGIVALGSRAGRGVLGLLSRSPRWTGLPDRAPAVRGMVEGFQAGVRRLGARPLRLLFLGVLSAVLWSTTIVAVRLILWGAGITAVEWGGALLVWAVTLSAMTAVPTPGFVGTFEAACVAALGLLGVDHESALPAALILHSGQLGFIVCLGGAYLLWEGSSLRRVVQRSRGLTRGPTREPSDPEPGSEAEHDAAPR